MYVLVEGNTGVHLPIVIIVIQVNQWRQIRGGKSVVFNYNYKQN